MKQLLQELNKKFREEKSNQRQLAAELHLQYPNLNAVLNGKRDLTIRMARALYGKYPDLYDVLLRSDD